MFFLIWNNCETVFMRVFDWFFKYKMVYIVPLYTTASLWSFQAYKDKNLQAFPVRIHLHGWCISQLPRSTKRNEAVLWPRGAIVTFKNRN